MVIGAAIRNDSEFLVANVIRELRESSNSLVGYLDFAFKFKFPIKRWP